MPPDIRKTTLQKEVIPTQPKSLSFLLNKEIRQSVLTDTIISGYTKNVDNIACSTFNFSN